MACSIRHVVYVVADYLQHGIAWLDYLHHRSNYVTCTDISVRDACKLKEVNYFFSLENEVCLLFILKRSIFQFFNFFLN